MRVRDRETETNRQTERQTHIKRDPEWIQITSRKDTEEGEVIISPATPGGSWCLLL